MRGQRFASDWGVKIPAACPNETVITCPNCGGGGASMDRVSIRVYGWHERCGWEDSMRMVTVNGQTVLEPWQ